MRTLRGALLGATALAIAVLMPPSAAQAIPTAPYTAFTLERVGDNYVFDLDNATIGLTMWGAEGFSFNARSSDGSTWLSAGIQAPTGTALAVGTYQTLRFADATHAGLSVSVASSGCNESAGTMTIHEVTRDATTNDVTAVAVSYSSNCPGDVKGEIRWNSSVGYKAAVSNPANIQWGAANIGDTTTAKTTTITGRGSSPVTLGAAAITGTAAATFSIVADTCSNTTLEYGESCTVTLRARPLSAGGLSATLSIPDDTYRGQRTVFLGVTGQVGAKGTFYPIPPARIMDTRSGVGTTKSPMAAGSTRTLQVAGRAGIAGTGVGAVVLNVTVTGPTAGGYLTVYPYGVSRPTASSLNFQKGWTRANSVTVAVGSGRVSIYNGSAGSTHVIVDVMGFYAANDDPITSGFGVGGQLQPVLPQRLLDTRFDIGAKLPAQYFIRIPVDYGADVNPYLRSLVVNVTAVSPDGGGYLTAWSGKVTGLPNTSTLNYTRGSVVPNLAVVPVTPCDNCGSATGLPSIGVYTSATTHVLVDIVAVFDDGTLADGLRFQPRTPTRIVDTRTGLGYPHALGAKATAKITAPGSVLVPDTEVLGLNVTAVNPSTGTYLTVWPDGISGIDRPTVSNLNPATGQTAPNAVVTLIGPANAFNIYNNAGTVHVLVDVVGAYWLYPGTASSLGVGDSSLRAETAGQPTSSLHATLAGPTVLAIR